jgi:nucleoid-associated protein YgaU
MPRATMTRLDKGGSPVGTSLTVSFNPKELTFSRSITWNPKKSPKTDQPEVEFGGGSAASLKLQLLFDTYVTTKEDGTPVEVEPSKIEDVRKKYLNYLYQWTRVDKDLKEPKSQKGRPPEVRFEWGEIIFEGVIQSISQRLTLFLPNGRPVRAVVDLTMTESRDAKLFEKQNPTSGGLGGERVWVVREGDTLPWIAYREYNDATEWRAIADANGLTQVRRLVPGTALVIPSV